MLPSSKSSQPVLELAVAVVRSSKPPELKLYVVRPAVPSRPAASLPAAPSTTLSPPVTVMVPVPAKVPAVTEMAVLEELSLKLVVFPLINKVPADTVVKVPRVTEPESVRLPEPDLVNCSLCVVPLVANTPAMFPAKVVSVAWFTVKPRKEVFAVLISGPTVPPEPEKLVTVKEVELALVPGRPKLKFPEFKTTEPAESAFWRDSKVPPEITKLEDAPS